MIREDREYRALSFETRKADSGEEKSYKVEGYASNFEPYVLYEIDGFQCVEQIDPEAFRDADLSDVIFLYDHEGMVYARNKNGTLDVDVNDKGLHIVADLSSTEQSRQMFEQIDAGLVDQMSFAFSVEDDSWLEEKDKVTRTIKKIKKVYDVSAVSIPANPGTDIAALSARNAFNGEIERIKAERLERAKEVELLKLKISLID